MRSLHPTAVCTLFEGDYHRGVGALTNSLHSSGYEGEVFAGYKGNLPQWILDIGKLNVISWAGSRTIVVTPSIRLHLLPLETENHLTNYKPDFILELWDKMVDSQSAIFFFDPDLYIATKWKHFEDWLDCGIALCEDVNSPLGENHPRRMGWRSYFKNSGYDLNFKNSYYVNGGCIGLRHHHRNFIECWRDLQLAMAPAVGGLASTKLQGGSFEVMRNPFFCFNASDQDALNAAIECCEAPVSILGKEAMGFSRGLPMIPHALGRPKPWSKPYITQALRGYPPSPADKEYWKNTTQPLAVEKRTRVKFTSIQMKIAAFIGRFYRRS